MSIRFGYLTYVGQVRFSLTLVIGELGHLVDELRMSCVEEREMK